MLVELLEAYLLLNLLALYLLAGKVRFTGDLGLKNKEDATSLELGTNYIMFPAWFIMSQLIDYGVKHKYRLETD